MKEKLEFDVFYPHPPERVWEALTDSDALTSWLLPTDFKPVPGYRFSFEGLQRQGSSTVRGVVIEAEPARKLIYTWEDDVEGNAGCPSVVSWTLNPKEGGTQVRLEHVAATYAEPHVVIEASMNWSFALFGSVPQLLREMARGRYRQPTPIVYVSEEPQPDNARRAGFRQEEEATC